MNEYELGVTYRFAAFCKKVLKLSAYKWYAKRKRHEEREVSLSLICEEYEMDFQDPTNYFEATWSFRVFGMDVNVSDERIAGVFESLKENLREVILLYYFLNFNHEEISKICGCSVRTVIRRKQRALDILQKELRDKHE